MERLLPNFDNLKPSIITRSINNIKKSKYYNKDYSYKKPTFDKFLISYDKLKKKDDLISKDYKVLSYNIDILVKENNFKEFKTVFIENIDNIVGIRGLVRPLMSYLYSNKIKFQEDVYQMLESVLERVNKSRFYYVKDLVLDNSIDDFKKTLCEKFYEFGTIKEINQELDRLFMKGDDQFYHNAILGFIIANHNKVSLFDWSKSIVKSMDINVRNKVLEGIILKYENEAIENCSEKWFLLAKDFLGEPYAMVGNRWLDIDERCREIFRRWFNNKNIYEFFSSEVADGDRRRLEFWKKYIDEIYRIEYIKDANRALLMEFKNHLFIEFAQQSNATYVYKKEIYNMDKIKQRINKRYGQVDVYTLKDKVLVEKRLMHRMHWEFDFKDYINGLGYKIK